MGDSSLISYNWILIPFTKNAVSQYFHPHVPHQNGIACRTEEYLIDFILTLLLESQVPPMFWG